MLLFGQSCEYFAVNQSALCITLQNHIEQMVKTFKFVCLSPIFMLCNVLTITISNSLIVKINYLKETECRFIYSLSCP